MSTVIISICSRCEHISFIHADLSGIDPTSHVIKDQTDSLSPAFSNHLKQIILTVWLQVQTAVTIKNDKHRGQVEICKGPHMVKQNEAELGMMCMHQTQLGKKNLQSTGS